MTNPEIEELKSLVEQKGKLLATTTDFEVFTLQLEKATGKSVSASTLKRLYGYVGDSHKPRITTPDVLAEYLGNKNYIEYVKWLKTSVKYNSSYFKSPQLVSNELQEGAKICIGWSPNRLLKLRYLGGSVYEIEDAENSKLIAGDRFTTGCFIKEQPLYLPYIERNGERTSPFVAGRNGGLTIIKVESNGDL